jgi:hypothetical protein
MTAMPAGTGVPWAPEGLPLAAEVAATCSYVVLEEIVDGVALLRRWPWPVVDSLGRLIWPGGSEHRTDSATISIAFLRAQLYEPNGTERQPRCGDTFAVPAGGHQHWRARQSRDLRDVFGDAVYDISADAREAVKIAYQASLGAVQPIGTADPAAREAVATMLQQRAQHELPLLRIHPPPNGHARRNGNGR